MNDDLYKILGVGRTAKPETIERAFRRMAMRHHPDRGGDKTKFEQMMRAYEVLSDPARRAKYDETGEASLDPDNSNLQVVEELVGCLMHILNTMRQSGRDPTKVDLVSEMTNA